MFKRKFTLKEKIKKQKWLFYNLRDRSKNFYENENFYSNQRNREYLSLVEYSLNDYLVLKFLDLEHWFKNEEILCLSPNIYMKY